jgi:predicted methyltransferase
MRYLLLSASALVLAACGGEAPEAEGAAPAEAAEAVSEEASEKVDMAMDEETMSDEASLDVVLGSQPEDVQARYQYRHPKETLMFFGVKPGMTVVDTLPGNPWYSGILINYLGPEGKVVGADYSPEMWTYFGEFSPEPGSKDNWPSEWTADAETWRDDDGDAAVGAVQFGAVPEEMLGAVDVILQVRSIHHFTRLEDEGEFMTKALADMNALLKPGGHVGVVAHRAPEESPDEWATGDNGYIKQSAVIAAFEGAGFELVDTSEVNANPKDQPVEGDFVWRLPPTLATSRDNDELRAEMEAIGESDRMTLLFRKPA